MFSSLLSNRPIRIKEIRENKEQPGLKEFEVKFLNLIDELTDGTTIDINTTGTQVVVKPGIISGGRFSFNCKTDPAVSEERSILYYVEGILPLCLFAKQQIHITFQGITDDDVDSSVEVFNNVTANIFSYFKLETLPNLKLHRRACENTSNLPRRAAVQGTIVFTCPVIREVKAIDLTDPGFVKRIRGLAYTIRVSPQFSNRIVDSCRGIFNNLIPDVYINTDVSVGAQTREYTEPGFGVSLWASTTHGKAKTEDDSFGDRTPEVVYYSSKRASHYEQDSNRVISPEKLGELAAMQLCEEIAGGGCVDSNHQYLVLLLMVLARNVSRIRLGRLTEYTIEFLRLLKTMFGVKFKIDVSPTSVLQGQKIDYLLESKLTDEDGNTSDEINEKTSVRENSERLVSQYHSVLLSCKGIAYENRSRHSNLISVPELLCIEELVGSDF